MASDDTTSQAREWLNGLSLADASSFYNFIRTRAGAVTTFNSVLPVDFEAYASIDPAVSADGDVWAEHVSCDVLQSGRGAGLDLSSSYPRFQLKFGSVQHGAVKTPSKASSIGKNLKEVLSQSAWSGLKAAAEQGAGKKFVVNVHHLAYTVRRLEDPGLLLGPLPADLGAGRAIAHLCDHHMCCKKTHMQLKTQSYNMSMQRCLGATLLVRDGVVIQVAHCPHYDVQADGVVVQPDCAKIRVVPAGPVISIAPNFAAAFEAARARYQAKLQAIEVVIDDEEDDWL